MTTLPLNLTSFGVGSDKMGDYFHIYFFSLHNMKKLYLSDGELTEELSKALVSDDMGFITNELTNLLVDDGFVEYLESELLF